mgnify:CR=1 FL=1
MITRRHIRVKVMQLLYTKKFNAENVKKNDEDWLYESYNNFYNLYLFLLSLLIKIKLKTENHLKINEKKYIPSNINIYKKISKNRIFNKIESYIRLLNFNYSNIQLDWNNYTDYLSIIWNDIFKDKICLDYANQSENNLINDKKFILKIYKKNIVCNLKLQELVEDISITGIDDFPLVNSLIINNINNLFKNDSKSNRFLKKDDDINFMISLFKQTINNEEFIENQLIGKTPNWDKERIAGLDYVILKMAISELLYFPSIPVKATINEYLEIAKEYATPKSAIFINGVLDNSLKDLTSKKMIHKMKMD